VVLERRAAKRRLSVASGTGVCYSTGPQARENVAPAVRPGFGMDCDTAPEGRKIRRAGLLRPSGAVHVCVWLPRPDGRGYTLSALRACFIRRRSVFAVRLCMIP
jgi:hypothetical protein